MTTAMTTVPKRRGNPAWVKGVSGNPSGKRKLWSDYRGKLSTLEQKARLRLGKLLQSENEHVALQAITLFYAYTLGKPMDGDVLAQMDTMLQRRLEAMKALANSEPAEELRELPAPASEAVVTPEQASPPALPPESPEATDGPTTAGEPVGAPSGLRCLYRGKEGQCQEMAADGQQWCQPHKAKLFAAMGET